MIVVADWYTDHIWAIFGVYDFGPQVVGWAKHCVKWRHYSRYHLKKIYYAIYSRLLEIPPIRRFLGIGPI